MVWLIYWIICGLIVFGLTNPTVEVFYFKSSHIVEFIASMLLGGIIIPILLNPQQRLLPKLEQLNHQTA